MVTLGRGQLEDKELDGWGVSWLRDQQAPSGDRCVKFQNIKETMVWCGGGDQIENPGKDYGLVLR